MANQYSGKVVLVTGAGTGIGFALCRAYALEGAMVALNDIDADLAKESARKINGEVGAARVFAFSGDVAEVGRIREIVASISKRFKRLDVAVANAGVTLSGKFLDYEPAEFDRLLAVNLRGTYFTAQAAARLMVEKKIAGRILLMSSVAGFQAFGGLGTYGITKAGIRMMVKTTALELGKYGITVNAVAPGATVTERTLNERPNYDSDWAKVTPNQRAGQVHDVISAALFLSSPDSRHITGQTLLVDGGWTIHSPLPEDY